MTTVIGTSARVQLPSLRTAGNLAAVVHAATVMSQVVHLNHIVERMPLERSSNVCMLRHERKACNARG